MYGLWIWCVFFRGFSIPVLWSDDSIISQLANPKVKSQALDLPGLQGIVKADSKQRYDLVLEGLNSGAGEWWIRANQGHSIKVCTRRTIFYFGIFLTILRLSSWS